jgi:hypothetical protein
MVGGGSCQLLQPASYLLPYLEDLYGSDKSPAEYLAAIDVEFLENGDYHMKFHDENAMWLNYRCPYNDRDDCSSKLQRQKSIETVGLLD